MAADQPSGGLAVVRELTQDEKDSILGFARDYVERSKLYRLQLRDQAPLPAEP